jgi:hypothetical protein
VKNEECVHTGANGTCYTSIHYNTTSYYKLKLPILSNIELIIGSDYEITICHHFPPSWCPTVPLFKNPETGVFLGFRDYGKNALPRANMRQNNKQPRKQGVLASVPLV